MDLFDQYIKIFPSKREFMEGDVVYVRKDLTAGLDYGSSTMAVKLMVQYAGQETKITSAFLFGETMIYKVEVDKGSFLWTREMFD